VEKLDSNSGFNLNKSRVTLNHSLPISSYRTGQTDAQINGYNTVCIYSWPWISKIVFFSSISVAGGSTVQPRQCGGLYWAMWSPSSQAVTKQENYWKHLVHHTWPPALYDNIWWLEQISDRNNGYFFTPTKSKV
jgi:hypothetical protein